jgi:hypothetical protein
MKVSVSIEWRAVKLPIKEPTKGVSFAFNAAALAIF